MSNKMTDENPFLSAVLPSLRGMWAEVVEDVYTMDKKKKRLRVGERVLIIEHAADADGKISVRKKNQHYPLHFIPLKALALPKPPTL